MDQEKMEKNLSKTIENIKQYVNLKTELYSLIIIERTAKVLSRVILLLIVTMLMFFFLLFLSFAFVQWFGYATGSESVGYVIIAAFYLLIGVVIFRLRKRLFLDPLLRGITEIFAEDEDVLDKSVKQAGHEEDQDQ